jgi:16S rRNA processing protein RimM
MESWVAIGRFGSPVGVKGWLRVVSYANPPENIFNYLPWHVFKGGVEVLIQQVKERWQGQALIVNIDPCQDRDTAKTFTHLEIYIDRKQLPPLNEEECYWVDLIGLHVFNQEQIELGVVDSLLATGANDVLIVKEPNGKKRYIPYIDQVIIAVDLENERLQVDWDAAF